jgi:hypothetical protein
MKGCPQRREAGIINLWNSKNFSSYEKSRLPTTPSIFNPSNEGVISENKNGNECVDRRAQNDLPLRPILLKRGGILDCRIFYRAPKYRTTIPNHFPSGSVVVVVAAPFLQVQDHLRLHDCNGGKKGNIWGMVR